MANYQSNYTGAKIDEAIGIALSLVGIEAGTGNNSIVINSTTKNTESGYENIASGLFAYAEGGRRPDNTETTEPTVYPQVQALGDFSHAEGASTIAAGKYAHAQNKQSRAYGEASTAMGAACVAGDPTDSTLGKYALAMGEMTVATGRGAVAMGSRSVASGMYSWAMGSGDSTAGTYSIASGDDAISAGYACTASGNYSFAQGYRNSATGPASVAFGFETESRGNGSMAFGDQVKAVGQGAVALGVGAQASNSAALAIGQNTKATGMRSFAGGSAVTASGDTSFAFGSNLANNEGNTEALKVGSIAIGRGASCNAQYGTAIGLGIITGTVQGQMVIGRWNVAPGSADIFVVGVGTQASRKNGLVINSAGNVTFGGNGTFAGQVTVSAEDPTSDNQLTRKKFVVDNFAPKVANGYIPKLPGKFKVYVNNGNGSLDMLDFAKDTAKVNSVAVRNANGQLWCATPTNTSHAATKKYVDDLISSAVVDFNGSNVDTPTTEVGLKVYAAMKAFGFFVPAHTGNSTIFARPLTDSEVTIPANTFAFSAIQATSTGLKDSYSSGLYYTVDNTGVITAVV